VCLPRFCILGIAFAIGWSSKFFSEEARAQLWVVSGVVRQNLHPRLTVCLLGYVRDALSFGLLSREAPSAPHGPALSQSVWPRQFGEPGIFSAPKLPDFYRTPSMPT